MSTFDRSSDIWGLNRDDRDIHLVVSLTTYPDRGESAAYVIDRMMRQSVLPDEIILALAKDEYPKREDVPGGILALEKRGLTIVFVENLKSHKKYHYALGAFPSSLVATVDDDILYSLDHLRDLVMSYRRYPHAVSAMWGNQMRFREGVLLPNRDWGKNTRYSLEPQLDIMALGGTALYPPGVIPIEALDGDAIRGVCLNADDIWLKFMQLKQRTPVVMARRKRFPCVDLPDAGGTPLMLDNVGADRNSFWVRRCMEFHGWDDAAVAGIVGRGGSA